MTPPRVSIHGGHSGQFCNHASDTLEAVVRTYLAQGFAWVGLTEHMPPYDDAFLYPEERRAGLDPAAMQARFGAYMTEARRLQAKYAGRLEIFVGFETETRGGSAEQVRRLLRTYRPDYILGGVHHVDDVPFDYSVAEYQRAAAAAGGIEALYCRYFDLQFEMLQDLKPAVVAHFDLIRLFDPDYARRWQHPAIAQRLSRNLALIRHLDLILDFNVAALRKGAAEPYVSRPLLMQARDLGIAVVPGDDSHGVATVGAGLDEGMAILQAMGFDTAWRKPSSAR